jgi:hypothetical protein
MHQGYIGPNEFESRDGATSTRIEPMPTLNRGPAEIIAFPPRGRYAAASLTDDVIDTRTSARVAKAASGSSWYHEEAIREERTKSN